MAEQPLKWAATPSSGLIDKQSASGHPANQDAKNLMYIIVITKKNENPNFQKELEEYQRDNRHANPMSQAQYPEKYIEEKQLQCCLTDEEFTVVKKAVLACA